MKPLLLDFVRRWRWVFLFAVPYAMFPAPDARYMEFPIGAAVMLLGAVLCAWEIRQGSVRVYGILPVPRRTAVNAIWVESIFLFPLLFLCVEVLRWPIHLMRYTQGNGLATSGVLSVLGVGCASLIMLCVTTSLPGASKVRASVLAPFWGVATVAAMHTIRYVHMSPQEVLAFPNNVAVGAAVILAYLCRLQLRRLLGFSALRPVAVQTPVSAPHWSAPAFPSRLKGRLDPILREFAFVAAFFSCLMAPYFFLPWWFSRGESADAWVSADIWALIAMIVTAKLTVLGPAFVLIPAMRWFTSIRPLRMLPCSRSRLTTLLLIRPAVLALMISAPVLFLLLAVAGAKGAMDATARVPDMLVTSGMNLAAFFMLPGFIFLGLVAYARLGLIPLLLLVLGGQVFMCLTILRIEPIGVMLPSGGLAAGGIAILLIAVASWGLHYLLGNSNAVYRHRSSEPHRQ